MYKAIRKYYEQIIGTALTLSDDDITGAIIDAGRCTTEDLIQFMSTYNPAAQALPIKYDRAVFKHLKCISDELHYDDMRKALLPSIAFSVSEDERANWSETDLRTYLMDGITVGGHTVREQAVIDGVRDAYALLPGMDSGKVELRCLCTLHSVLMRKLVRDETQLGCIRTRRVYLRGIDTWKSLPVDELERVYNKEVAIINRIPNTVERAVVAMMWLQYRQFFIDGNKRVSRFMCNAILGAEQVGVFCIPAKYVVEYQRLLADFYRTADATAIINFTVNNCLGYFPDETDAHWPGQED